MKRLTILWNRYKALKWWQKALLFLPLVVCLVLLVFVGFIPKSDGKKFEGSVEHHRQYVNEQIAKRDKADKLLEKRDRRLQEAQVGLQKEIEQNEIDASTLIDRIDRASDAGDELELERIQSELNAASKRRAKP